MMTPHEVIELARQYVQIANMRSSAELALSDAEHLLANGDPTFARKRAVTSLAYSVGILHPDYQKAVRGC